MAKYRIQINDQDDNPIGEVTNWFDLKFSRRLNDFGECTFSFSADDELMIPLIALRRYQTKIYRNDSLVWAGEQVVNSGSLKANSDNKSVITSYEYLEQLASRYTGAYRRFSSTDAGTIAWTLIDESQSLTNGDFGITQGTIETTKNRDRTYENKNILDAIKDLSAVIDGFDFELTPDKVFNVYSQKGIDRSTTTVFDYGTNILDVLVTENFGNPYNSSIVIGEDNRVERTDSTAASIYKLRQSLINASGVTEDTTLNDKGDSNNRKYKGPLLKVSFGQIPGTSPSFGSLSLGDIVRIRVDRGIYNVSNNFRIYGYNVAVSQQNQESVSYTVGLI
jgi:hypothetical protein